MKNQTHPSVALSSRVRLNSILVTHVFNEVKLTWKYALVKAKVIQKKMSGEQVLVLWHTPSINSMLNKPLHSMKLNMTLNFFHVIFL